MLPIDVLERDQSGRPVAHEERDPDRGQRRFPHDRERLADLGGSSRDVVVHNDRLPRLERHLAEADDLDRVRVEANPSFDLISEMDESVGRVEDLDIDDLRVEDLLDPVADEVVHRLHIEPFGEPPLHVVDERELGVALPGLLEQPSVLERNAKAPRERREAP